jgi:hypothetical protein
MLSAPARHWSNAGFRGQLQYAVSQGGLPVIDMGNNAKVTYLIHVPIEYQHAGVFMARKGGEGVINTWRDKHADALLRTWEKVMDYFKKRECLGLITPSVSR